MPLTDDIRAAAARVAGEARHVRIRSETIEAYAATLPAEAPPTPDLEGADDETRAAFSLQLNAINFGSGWFPTLRKPAGPVRIPDGRGRPAPPRAVDRHASCGRSPARRSRRRSAKTPGTS